jgi:adenylate kinase family enzyme
LADEDGILVLSTGDILRSAVRRATPLGLRAQGYMRAGELVPDELIDGLMAARIADDDARAGFILADIRERSRKRAHSRMFSSVFANRCPPRFCSK